MPNGFCCRRVYYSGSILKAPAAGRTSWSPFITQLERQLSMDTTPNAVSSPPSIPPPQAVAVSEVLRGIKRSIRDRILGGLLFVLPIVITFWVIRWLYSGLEYNVIDPLAGLVLWKLKWIKSTTELPYWFETFVAPMIAVLIVLLLLYGLGFIVNSRLRRSIEWFMLRVPVISVIYDGLRSV